MGQSITSVQQGFDWTDSGNYARHVRSDRRTWAWLWLTRNQTFQEHATAMGTVQWAYQDGSIILLENLCRHF